MADIHYSAAAVETEQFAGEAVRQDAVVADIPVDSPAADVVAAQQDAAVQVLVLGFAVLALQEVDYLTGAAEVLVLAASSAVASVFPALAVVAVEDEAVPNMGLAGESQAAFDVGLVEWMHPSEAVLQEAQESGGFPVSHSAVLQMAHDVLRCAVVPADALVLVYAVQHCCQWMAFSEIHQVLELQVLPAYEYLAAAYHPVHCCSSYVRPCFLVSSLERRIYGPTRNYHNYQRCAEPFCLTDTRPFDACRGLFLLCHCRQTQSVKSAACRDNVQ